MQAHIVTTSLEAVMEVCERKRIEASRGVQVGETYVRRGSDCTRAVGIKSVQEFSAAGKAPIIFT